MTGKMLKALILAAVALSALAGAASASATTWTSNGTAAGTSFTATAPASQLNIAGSALTCTSPRATGKLFGPTGALTAPVASLTPAYTGCIAAGWTFVWTCTTDGLSFYAASYAAPVVTGTLRVAAGRICSFTIPAIPGCLVTISPTNGIGTAVVNATYDNTRGTLTWSHTGQQLTGSWSGCGTLFGSSTGSGPVSLTGLGGGDLTYTATAAFVPNITI